MPVFATSPLIFTTQNVTNTSSFLPFEQNPAVVTDGTNVYVAWSANSDTFFAKSTDGGITFTTQVIPNNLTNFEQNFHLILDDTDIYITWNGLVNGNNEIILAKSTDGGITFTTQNITNTPTIFESAPDVVVDGTNVYVTWTTFDGTNNDIFFVHSTDGGITFTTQNITNTSSLFDQNSIVAIDGTTIFVTWSSYNGDTSDIFIASSPIIPSNNPPNCSIAIASNESLWPPNHKLIDIVITGITDPDGDSITTIITKITQDEAIPGPGKKHSPDGNGIGTNTAEIRAERDGSGNGRVYEISFTVDDDNGGTCDGSVQVGVPHDQSNTSAIDDGQIFDSTQ